MQTPTPLVAILGAVLTAAALALAAHRASTRRLERAIRETALDNRRCYLAVRDALDALASRDRPVSLGERIGRAQADAARQRSAARLGHRLDALPPMAHTGD